MTLDTSPNPYTPEFHKRAAEHILADNETHAAWLATNDFEALIEEAIAAGRAAHKAAEGLPEQDAERSTWVEIDFGHRRSEPLVRELYERNIGIAEIAAWGWFINVEHVLGKRRRGQYGTARQCHAAVEAFAMALSRPGFELKITRE